MEQAITALWPDKPLEKSKILYRDAVWRLRQTLKENEFTVVPTYGEPFLLIDTVAALSNNSINWISNGIEYYIVSDVMNQNELIEVAKSVNVISVLK